MRILGKATITITMISVRTVYHFIQCHSMNIKYYTDRALQTSANDMHPGTMLLYHPIYDSPGYQLRDKDLRDACCGVDGFCQDVDFFSRRPIINCDNYSPPSSCMLINLLCREFVIK